MFRSTVTGRQRLPLRRWWRAVQISGIIGLLPRYSGDSNHPASSVTMVQKVHANASTTALTSSFNPSVLWAGSYVHRDGVASSVRRRHANGNGHLPGWHNCHWTGSAQLQRSGIDHAVESEWCQSHDQGDLRFGYTICREQWRNCAGCATGADIKLFSSSMEVSARPRT